MGLLPLPHYQMTWQERSAGRVRLGVGAAGRSVDRGR